MSAQTEFSHHKRRTCQCGNVGIESMRGNVRARRRNVRRNVRKRVILKHDN